MSELGQSNEPVRMSIGTRVRYGDYIYEVSGYGGSLPEHFDCSFRLVGHFSTVASRERTQ